MIATHLKPEWSERRIARISLIPAPWDEPEPEPAHVQRIEEPARVTVTTLRPRIPAQPNRDTFCAHDEDALRIAMQRIDGVVANRFPPVPNPKQARDYKPGSLASRVREVIRQDGPSTAQHVADRLGIRLSSATNCLCDQRGNGRATCEPETRVWSLT